MTTIPPFPALAFPNAITVQLCEPTVNVEGGANPGGAASINVNASVQPKGSRWVAENGSQYSITEYVVFFQADPNPLLTRPIRAGDQILWNSLVLTVIGPCPPRGGLGWLWSVKCQYVKT